jgi:hypothetical protein
MIVMSLAVLLGAGRCLFAQSHGTAALAIWSPERAVLAADSKLSRLDGKQDSAGCKIRAAGRMFFIASGYYGRPGGDFDVWTSVRDAVREATSVRDAADVSEKQLKPVLLKKFRTLREDNKIASSEEAANASRFSVYFAGVDEGKVVVAGWSLRPGGDVIREEYPGDHRAVAGSRQLINFGEHAATDAEIPRPALIKMLADPINAAARMIQIEIDREPASVGPPRSILEITPSKHRWVEKGLCGNDDGNDDGKQ